MLILAKIDSPQFFLIYYINIHCLSNLAELCAQVKTLDPHLILLQETWLKKKVEAIHIPGYNIVSKRDRNDTENRSGIIRYARQDVYHIVCIKNSVAAGRSWHYLHLDVGTVAVCNWYRPPASSDEAIATLQEEMWELKGEVVGIIIMDDCNTHHARWLRYSSGNSVKGVFLKQHKADCG